MTPKEACDIHLKDSDLVPKDKKTFCNFFCQRVLNTLGFNDFNNLTANKINDYLIDSKNWSILNSDQAYEETMLNKLVVASINGNPNGHIAILYPEIKLFSGKWNCYVPQVANVGNKVGIMGLNYSFKEFPLFFVRK